MTLREVTDEIKVGLLAAGFYLIIWISAALAFCQMIYWRLTGVPFIKVRGKFHNEYIRSCK